MKAKLGFTVNFKDFFTKKAFLSMQDRFKNKDINRKEIELIMSIDAKTAEQFKSDIIDYSVEIDIGNIEPNFPSKWLFKDVLGSNIDDISKRFIKEFNKKIEDKGIYGVQPKADFAGYERKKIAKVENNLGNLNYDLLNEFKTSLLEQYQTIQEFLNSFIVETIQNNNRLNFKMNRTDIILLFELLQRNSKIEMCEKQRLASLIDILFNYQTENSNYYEPIKDSRKVFSDLKKGNKTFNQSYERLRKLFQEDIKYEPAPIG